MTLCAYVFAFQRPDATWGAINDADRRLVIALTRHTAAQFAIAFARRGGPPVQPLLLDPFQLVELIRSAGVAGPIYDKVTIIDADAEDHSDEQYAAAECANTIPMDSFGDWVATGGRAAA